MATTSLPVVVVHAADATPAAPAAAIETSSPGPAPEVLPFVPAELLQSDSKPGDLTYKMDVPAAAPRPDDLRFDFAQRPASDTTLMLSPVVSAPRAGWAVSGRVGPLRWLTPVAGEGELAMRLGARVPGQPHTPGMGNLNINVHYTFE
jgi:hypothetical protein